MKQPRAEQDEIPVCCALKAQREVITQSGSRDLKSRGSDS